MTWTLHHHQLQANPLSTLDTRWHGGAPPTQSCSRRYPRSHIHAFPFLLFLSVLFSTCFIEDDGNQSIVQQGLATVLVIHPTSFLLFTTSGEEGGGRDYK